MKEALRIMKEQGKGWVKVAKEGAVWTGWPDPGP